MEIQKDNIQQKFEEYMNSELPGINWKVSLENTTIEITFYLYKAWLRAFNKLKNAKSETEKESAGAEYGQVCNVLTTNMKQIKSMYFPGVFCDQSHMFHVEHSNKKRKRTPFELEMDSRDIPDWEDRIDSTTRVELEELYNKISETEKAADVVMFYEHQCNLFTQNSMQFLNNANEIRKSFDEKVNKIFGITR